MRSVYCQNHHSLPCPKCEPLINVAKLVLSNGHIQLSVAFKSAYPTQTYKTDIAIQRFLQMPLVCIKPKERQTWFLVEFVEGTKYMKFVLFVDALVSKKAAPVSKGEVRSLLEIAQSNREHELVRYSIFKASGISYTAARKTYGFQDMRDRETRIKTSVREAREICEAIDDLAKTEDDALLSSMGIDVELSESDADSDTTDNESSPILDHDLPDTSALVEVLETAKYNWLEVLDHIEKELGHVLTESSHVMEYLKEVYLQILSELDAKKRALPQQSYCASLALLEVQEGDDRCATALNGEIVSDSDSDPGIPVTSIASSQAKKIIESRRKSLVRKVRRRKAKALAEKWFLLRKVSKKVKSICDQFPDIGSVIEEYVRNCDVGADKWRRTGVLTFDGNQRINKKVTFERIREHLHKTYGRTFSYGTVVQLCVARNKRHQASANYRGIAKVTSRRARKGFQLKYNPDAHWSNAFYRTLDYVQYQDGTNITIINRDDASGFRLDTLATNSEHKTLVVNGQQTVTTHTDYVNRYPSSLQTTSYNSTGTSTTGELCAGVVKPVKIFPKNPAQHFAHLKKLSLVPELEPAFINHISGKPKEIECVRVDGTVDEGPGHLEVQFWWTARHIEEKKVVTMVTSRSSGSSYLNRVELQNGCWLLHMPTFSYLQPSMDSRLIQLQD